MDAQKRLMKSFYRTRIVGASHMILEERRWVGQLIRAPMNAAITADSLDRFSELLSKVRNAHRLKVKIFDLPARRFDLQFVITEVERCCNGRYRVGYGASCQAARGYIEGRMPRVVDPKGMSKSIFPDDLTPKMKRLAGFLPRCEWDIRPAQLFACRHRVRSLATACLPKTSHLMTTVPYRFAHTIIVIKDEP